MGDDRWAAAWEERARLLRLARRRLPTFEDAEDVVAEAIQRAGHQVDLPLEAVPAWLTRVTVNLCTDRIRRLATQRALLARAELRQEHAPPPEDEVTTQAQAVWIAQQLSSLPARQAEALLLRASGLPNPAIAARLGVSVATVEGLVKRSRAALRQALKAAGAILGGLAFLRPRAHKPALVVVVLTSLTLLLLPWNGTPGVRLAPPSSTRAAPTPRHPGAPRTRLLSSSGHVTSALPAPSQKRVAVDPLRGRASVINGPQCLMSYCIPVVDDQAQTVTGSQSPRGWSPRDLWDYLGEPARSVSAERRRPLVAIVSVDSFDFTASDLAVYRRTFHLPPCTVGSGCLTLLAAPEPENAEERLSLAELQLYHAENLSSARTLGRTYSGNPAGEQAQMLQGVSASCPECRLAVVSAVGPNAGSLAQAYRTVRTLAPDVVISVETATRNTGGSSFDDLYDSSLYGGMLVLSGVERAGYTAGSIAPASLPNVIAVGGTLPLIGRPTSALDGTQSFCNTEVAQPSWQRSSRTGCAGRAGVDLAGPTGKLQGLSVFVSASLRDPYGWYHPGHISQALAVAGGLFARHNVYSVVRGPSDLYAHPAWFTDIAMGATVGTASGATSGCAPGAPQICHARNGWDGPTGLGEPRHLPWF